MIFRKAHIWILVIMLAALQANGQGTQTEFGKNVIQHKEFEWYYYSSANFDVYFYTGGKELARYAITIAEDHLKEIENKIDFPLDNRVTFIVYNSYTDFRQSNFPVTEEITNTGGRTRILANKVFIYFSGDHFDFTSQIRSGITQSILNEVIYGGSIQERVQNNVLLNLPNWYANGLVRYIGNGWSPQDETILRNGITSGRFKKFKRLTEEEANLIGQSLWKYVYDRYGEAALSNMLYIMRAHKSIESGYMFVLGKSFTQFYNEWYQFHLSRYQNPVGTSPTGNELTKLKKIFKKGTVTRWAISPQEQFAAVVVNDQGKTRLWVVNMATGKKKRIYKSGYRRSDNLFDYNYPVIGWNTRGQELTVVYEKKSQPFFFTYKADENKRSDDQLITRVERVLSFDYSDNGRTSVMSVVRNGQTDIITFDFRSMAQRNITNDIYDDLQPRYVRGKGLVFSSNRPEAKLERVDATQLHSFSNNYDIFYMPEATGKTIKRLSNSLADETMPDAYDTAYFSYLTDENGVINRNAVYLDSIFQHIRVIASYRDTSINKGDTLYFYSKDSSHILLPQKMLNDSNLLVLDTAFIYKDTLYIYPLTNYSENIQAYAMPVRTGSLYELFRINNIYVLYKKPIPENIPSKTVSRTKFTNFLRYQQNPESGKNKKNTGIKEPSRVFSDDLPDGEVKPHQQNDTLAQQRKDYFQTDFPAPTAVEKPSGTGNNQLITRNGINKNEERIKFSAASLYFLSFTPDYIVPLQFDNSLINSPYLPYDPNDNTSIYSPVIRGMFKLALSDMFKDYRLVGGFRMMANLAGAEYFVAFDNLRTRLDKRILFYRRGESRDNGRGEFSRVTSHELRGELRWPFSETASVRFSGFGRTDKITYLSGELVSLNKPNDLTYWGGARAEYVFDNVIPRGLNLYNGTRLKLYTELFNAFNVDNRLFSVVGADIRNYTKISRQIIWANRLAAASSFGQAKVVYFLGGVDNWLFPRFNEQNIVDPEQNYVYKTQATNMRGFDQNVRNGSSYAVLNSEIRVPIFKYLFNRPFRSQFFENFQVVGFGDVGTAWTGVNPFSIENAYTKRFIEQGPFKITVTSLRDPMVYGYGFGFRSVFLGYFVRLDYAWGIDDEINTGRKVYFSLGMDF